MLVPLVDLVAQYHSIQAEIDAAVQRVLARGAFILGPEVAALEEALQAYLGVDHAIGVASGTDALVLALRAYGIGPGDEVVVPTYTFIATAAAVAHVGATPVLVDVERSTYCLDVAGVERVLTPRTRAIVPVHLFGHPADMDSLREIARPRGVVVIEDAAQAIGAEYRGRKVGALGDAACFSFYPTKNLGACGDGGMVVTSDPVVAGTLRTLRTHGWKLKYEPEVIGVNSRLDELQAAILRAKLGHLDAWNARRRELAARYDRALTERVDGRRLLGVPTEAPGVRHAYHLYVIRVAQRDAVQGRLRSQGIATGVYYPRPLHQLPPYQKVSVGRGPFPEAERASAETLAIPLYPEMREEQVDEVVRVVRGALAETDVIVRS